MRIRFQADADLNQIIVTAVLSPLVPKPGLTASTGKWLPEEQIQKRLKAIAN